jgi:hypothetical protein
MSFAGYQVSILNCRFHLQKVIRIHVLGTRRYITANEIKNATHFPSGSSLHAYDSHVDEDWSVFPKCV